jgi:hypothetical protein
MNCHIFEELFHQRIKFILSSFRTRQSITVASDYMWLFKLKLRVQFSTHRKHIFCAHWPCVASGY